jgi:small-conductance mechanosensitive channel
MTASPAILASIILASILPQRFMPVIPYSENWKNWIWAGALVGAAIGIGLVVHSVFFRLARRLALRKSGIFWDLLVRYEQGPARVVLPVLILLALSPWLPLPSSITSWLNHAAGLILIASVAWAAIAMLDVLQDLVALGHALQIADNLTARRIRTQVQLLRHIVAVVIIFVAIAIMLMTFPNIRHLGESLFASAGLAAIVGGLAARSTLTNLFAGLQIALTQPIRIDDVVIVEGEWGWIEEITMTYVVVRIWDLRRLVVPLSYFIEKPFQNWTRKTADLLGTVFLYTDYTVPVDSVRSELRRILESSGMWDGKVWGLQVTNASEHTVELRALMSAIGSSEAWDLRCYVREKLIEFLQREYPASLPRSRADLVSLTATSGSLEKFEGADHAA